MKLTLVAIPYDSGHRDYRTGAGPRYLVDGGVRETLESLGHDADVVTLEATTSPTTEIATAFDLYRQLGREVRAAVSAGRQPVVFAGNCNCVVGTLGGLRRDDVALVFFDGHGDFNTPETTTTGFLDGMGLAMATGRCFKEMARGIEGFEPLRDSRVFLVGARDVDPLEREGLASSGVCWVTVDDARGGGLDRALSPLSKLAPKPALYLHFDMDVLDPGEARANRLAPPGGLTVDELLGAAASLRAGFEVAAVSIASVEPEGDEGGRTLAATARLIATLFPS